MKKQFIVLYIILFVQSFTILNVHSVNNGLNQEDTNNELLIDSHAIKDEFNGNESNQDLANYDNYKEEILISNDYLPIQDDYQKLSKIKSTVSSDAFISRWDTTKVSIGSSNSSQIKLPLEESGNYDFTVDWGDNTTDLITSYNQVEVTHNYKTPGEYILIINGTIKGWRFNNGGDKLKLLEISQWGNLNFGNSGYYFYRCENLELIATDAPDLDGTTTLTSAFYDCHNLGSNGDMNIWNVSRVINIAEMFHDASSFNQSLDSWDVSSVTNMEGIFYGTSSFNQPLDSWDVSSVTTMGYIFYGTSSFNQPLDSWDVSSVTDMSGMFYSASSFNQSLNSWDVSSVTTMGSMFIGASSFNQSLDSWDVSSVTTMHGMFGGASSFNKPLGDWDVSSVTTMSGMFSFASSFNQPLNNWNVSSVTTMPTMFSFASSFNQPLNNWNVSSVTNMYRMFYSALSFNQPLNNWNVSSVTNMSEMFHSASSFNQPIDSWDVSSVTNLHGMFSSASSFNQPIGNWDVSNVTDMSNIFYGVTLSYENYDNLLLAWSQLPLQSNVNFHAGYSKYSNAAVNAKEYIITTFFWSFSDGGLILLSPFAPQSLSSTLSDDKVNLTWQIPSDDGGSNITEYKIYRGSMSGSYTYLVTTTQLTFIDYTVSKGLTYYYVLTAVNAIGESDYSNETQITTPMTEPSAPLNLQATAGNCKVNLEWQKSIDNGGSVIIEYRIYRGTNNDSYTYLETTSQLSFIDNTVDNNVVYYYVVTAVNTVGESVHSDNVHSTPAPEPSVPLNLQVTFNNSKVNLSWEKPIDDGGLPITEYRIYCGTNNGSYIYLGKTIQLFFLDITVIKGITYYYVVTAVNSIGESDYSNETQITIPMTEPSAPFNLQATASDSEVTLTWLIPNDDGGSAIIEYRIYRGTVIGSYSYLVTTTQLQYIDSGVINGVTYYYVVTAVNSVGESNNSNDVHTTLEVIEESSTENNSSNNSINFEIYTPGFDIFSLIVVISLLSVIKLFKNQIKKEF